MKKGNKLKLVLTLLMALVMAFSACTTNNGNQNSGTGENSQTSSNGSTGNSSQTPDDEYTLERGENEKQLTIYFYREAGYENCDIWMWHAEANGRGYELHECAYGAKVILNVPNTINEVGFIIRTGCSDPGGESWGNATKDATDADRSVALKEAETVIYTKAGDAKSYTSTDGGKTLKEIKYISLADMQDANHVKFVLSSAMVFRSLADYRLTDSNGNLVELEKVSSMGVSSSNGVITTKTALDLANAYTLTIGDLDGVSVVPNTYFASAEFKENYLYDGKLGVELADGKTTFRLWAPTASKVTLNLFNEGNGGSAYDNILLEKQEKGVWYYQANENLSGKYYTYNVVTSMGDQEAVDPYAVSAGVNGNRGMILDLDSTDPENWTNEVYDNPQITNYTDAVIWEVHVRDFSNMNEASNYKGKFLAFTETGLKNSAGLPVGVDYLKELGITHVHLLPSYDYATVDEANPDSAFNWGYDPKNYNVPEGSYSTDPYNGEVRVNEFKQMVQALHNNGISVVMDVVYNHTYSIDSNLNRVVPYYYYRYNSNGTPSNGSGCGNETASDREMFRKYMIDSLVHWMTEYNVDGFRFDLMGLHDIETMKQIEKTVHAINPKALLYGEGWTGGSTPLTTQSNLANIKKVNADTKTNGVAMFNDVIRDAIKGSTNGNDTGFATGAQTGVVQRIKFGVNGGVQGFAANPNGWYTYNPTNVINYASAHDNLALWDKICWYYGENDSTLELRLKRNALSAAIVQTSLGIPFMQAGEEMLRQKKNADGSYNENSYNSSDEVNNLRWNFTEDSSQWQMMQYYKGLIQFRKSSELLRLTVASDRGTMVCAADSQSSGALLALTMTNPYNTGEKLFIVYNAGLSNVNVNLPQGTWDLYVNGQTAGATAIATGLSGSQTIEKISCYVYKRA
ncbi:MAG: type I pullulanase [Clostridia bacterium]|nr:type I pullulanase [Clostridia bacterium]